MNWMSRDDMSTTRKHRRKFGLGCGRTNRIESSPVESNQVSLINILKRQAHLYTSVTLHDPN
jgi:hypothetical protein